MSQSVNLPALGESVTEGTVTRWLKNVGDHVEVDEPLVEVSTDKVDTEIPSPIAGTLEEILVPEDETVEVGTPLARIGDGSGGSDSSGDSESTGEAEAGDAEATGGYGHDEQAQEQGDSATEEPAQEQQEQESAEAEVPSNAAPQPAGEDQGEAAKAPEPAESVDPTPAQPAQPAQPSAPATTSAPAVSAAPAEPSSTSANAGYVTPLVRKLANEKGIDLSTVRGTGVGGRIRKEDLETAATGSGSAAAARKPAEVSPLRGTTVPMSRLRKVISERAVASMQASAQLTSVVEVDITKVAQLRESVKEQFQQKTGVKLSFLPFFALAAAEALKSYPVINATIEGDSIVYPEQENLSIAVDTERGLLTPVVRDAGSLDIAGLATQVADLATRTRDNQLKPDELAGGTFTLTNTGSRGALFDTPVVFLPQSAILGTGIVTKRPVVVTHDGVDSIAIRSMVYLALSYDHRIVDGADASRFLVQVKNRLEEGDFTGNLGI